MNVWGYSYFAERPFGSNAYMQGFPFSSHMKNWTQQQSGLHSAHILFHIDWAEPLSDTYTKLTAWCLECANRSKKRTPAPFTHRICGGEELEEAGGIDKYIPVCRSCFIKLNYG